LKLQQTEKKIPEAEMVEWIWQGLMRTIDPTTKPEQVEGIATAIVTVCDVIGTS